MTFDELFVNLENNPYLSLLSITLLSLVVFLITRGVIARGLVYLANRTKTKYDDIIVDKLRPYRVTYIAPLLVFYLLANLISEAEYLIKQTALILMLWVAVITLNSLINALNEIYEGSPFLQVYQSRDIWTL